MIQCFRCCRDALEALLGVSGVHLNKKRKYIYKCIFNVFLYHFVGNVTQDDDSEGDNDNEDDDDNEGENNNS